MTHGRVLAAAAAHLLRAALLQQLRQHLLLQLADHHACEALAAALLAASQLQGAGCHMSFRPPATTMAATLCMPPVSLACEIMYRTSGQLGLVQAAAALAEAAAGPVLRTSCCSHSCAAGQRCSACPMLLPSPGCLCHISSSYTALPSRYLGQGGEET